MNNFNENFYYQGNNPNNSITDYWAQELNGTQQSDVVNNFPFDAGLAFNEYFVNPNPYNSTTSSQYLGTAPPGGVTQTRVGPDNGWTG